MSRHLPHVAVLLAAALVIAPVSGNPARASEVPALNELDDYLDELPLVLSATRLSQPISDSPASITVIDRELIDASGARSLTDLFRLVPGFQVGEPRAGAPVATYHGFGDEFQRRLQVLIDGRSVYIPLYGGVPWGSLPLSLTDIQRIEIVRGPNAAVYGPNAFSAVINITTRHAAEDAGLHVSAERGGEDEDRITLRGSYHAEQLDMRLTVEGRDSDGYRDRDDRASLGLLSGRLDYSLSASDALSAQFGLSDGDYAVGERGDPLDPLRDRGVRNYFAQLRWERNRGVDDNLSVQLYHNVAEWHDGFGAQVDSLGLLGMLLDFTLDRARSVSADPAVHDLILRADQALADGDLAAMNTLVQQAVALNTEADVAAWLAEIVHYLQTLPDLLALPANERAASFSFDGNTVSRRSEVEIQRRQRLGDSLRLVYGGSLRRDQVDAPGYMVARSPQSNHVYRLFGHAEWQLAENLLLNAGAMYEDNDITGSDISPRLALLYRHSPRSVWRLGYSRATRTPVLFERHANMRVDIDLPAALPTFDGDPQLSLFEIVASGGLRPETIEAWELGYRFTPPASRAYFDLKLFHEKIDDLIDTTIGEVLAEDDFNDTSSTYTNRSGMMISGAEIEASLPAGAHTRLRLGYAYANLWDVERDATSLPRQSLSLLLTHHPTPADTLSAEFYYVSDMAWMDASERFDLISTRRFDLRYAHRFRWRGADAHFSLQLENLIEKSSEYFSENVRYPSLYLRLGMDLY